MNYGTFKANDSVDCNSTTMTCFKTLFYSCCLRFRKRGSSLRGSAVRKSSIASSSYTGDGGSSVQSSSQLPDGGCTSSRSLPQGSLPSLDEDKALISSTPRTPPLVSYGSQNKELEESSHVPLISVLDCSEDVSEIPAADISDKLNVGKQDSYIEKTSLCSSRSEASLSPFEDEADDVVPVAVDSKKSSLVTQESDMDHLTSHRSQESASTERVQDDIMADVTSGSAEDEHFEKVKVNGDILFGINYNYKTGNLEVHIKECRNLSPVDVKKNRSDPYVKVYLLPDRSKTGKRKTKVKKHTLNPVFEEILKFPVTVSELERRTLWLTVWHSHFGKNVFLGEMMLPLEHDTIQNYGYKRHTLKERVGKKDSILKYNGDIVLDLKFLPSDSSFLQNQEVLDENTKGDLHVLVKEAKNLVPAYANGTSNPFCKSYLLPEKNKTSKQKTAVIKKNCNPKWNHTFVYSDVTLSDLKERCLELTIWSHDKISSNSFLGGVRLGLGGGKYEGCDVEWMDSAGEEVNLWNAMLHKPGMFVEGCLLLRAEMNRPDYRKASKA